MEKLKYSQAYMDMAFVFSKTSEAKRLKVGCLIVRDGQPISVGVNGTPSGWETNICEDENNVTQWFVKHAEVQALNKIRKSTLSSVGSSMYVTHSPCKNCCLEIIDAGIKTVYYSELYRDVSGIEILKSHGIEVKQLKSSENLIYEKK